MSHSHSQTLTDIHIHISTLSIAEVIEFAAHAASSNASSANVRNVTATSRRECAFRCVESRDFLCKSISYENATGMCQLRDERDGQFVRKFNSECDKCEWRHFDLKI